MPVLNKSATLVHTNKQQGLKSQFICKKITPF